MALNSTIHKAELQVSNLDRHIYDTRSFTVAQHPSETDIRMMVRLLVYALNIDERLEFTKGLSTDEEPDLWMKSLTGEVDLWIELGQPTKKRIKKACNRAREVKVYPYSGHGAEIWWNQMSHKVTDLDNLTVINLPAKQIAPLVKNLSRSMSLQCTIQDEAIWFGDEEQTIEITPEIWKRLG